MSSWSTAASPQSPARVPRRGKSGFMKSVFNGTKACLFMDLWCGTLTLMRRDGGERRYPDLAQAEIFPERAPAQNLVDSILGLATTVSPGALGLASMEVVDAACESARTGLNI